MEPLAPEDTEVTDAIQNGARLMTISEQTPAPVAVPRVITVKGASEDVLQALRLLNGAL